MKSFGVNYTSPIIPSLAFGSNGYFVKNAWKQERRASYLLPKKKEAAPKISRKWKF